MAKNEPNKPDEVKTGPENEIPTEEKATSGAKPLKVGSDKLPAEPTAGEMAAATHDGKEQPQAPAPSDISTDTVIPFAKIVSEQQAAKTTEKSAEDEKEPETPAPDDKAPGKKAVCKGRPPKADKAVKEPKSDKTPKADKAVESLKTAIQKDVAKEKTPPPASEQSPEPKEAPRKVRPCSLMMLYISIMVFPWARPKRIIASRLIFG
jgi:hypothetical protein